VGNFPINNLALQSFLPFVNGYLYIHFYQDWIIPQKKLMETEAQLKWSFLHITIRFWMEFRLIYLILVINSLKIQNFISLLAHLTYSNKYFAFKFFLVIIAFQEFICDKGIGFVRIDGTTLPRDRQLAVQSFQFSSEVCTISSIHLSTLEFIVPVRMCGI